MTNDKRIQHIWQGKARRNEDREILSLDSVRIHIKFNNNYHMVTYHNLRGFCGQRGYL